MMKSSQSASILVVDDEVGVTRLCARFLERAGHKSETVNRPQDALAVLDKQKIDLLLADIRMPEMGGFELMTLARQKQPELAVVIMTGYGTVETAVESLHQGADGMVLKPFSGAELVQSVERALRDRRREGDMLRLRALQPLFAITEALFTEKAPSRQRQLLMEAACKHLDCEHAGLYQDYQDEPELKLVVEIGKALPADDPLIQEINRTRGAILIHVDGPGDPDLQRILIEKGLATLMCVSTSEGGTRTTLFVGRAADKPPFGDPDLEMLGILVRQAAVAFDNSRLYNELQKHIRQVEASQQALAQAEKMAAVGRLTASIAHEINNPLQSMQNCLHLAGHAELPSERRDEYLNLAKNELERLMTTVRRMLDFYRPSALERRLASINSIIERTLNLLAAQLKSQNVVIHRHLGQNLPDVLVVENQIQQVIFNLVLNAMEAMPSGGDIFIKSTLENGEVQTCFEDTGPGIAAGARDQIFEPFVSTKEKGLGLGLAVSYGIITAHGGRLELLPSEKGACFCLSLPVEFGEGDWRNE